MKTAIKSSRPIVHFCKKDQILGGILENKGFQNLNLRKDVRNKKYAPTLVFLKKIFFLKILIIFDITTLHHKLIWEVRFWPFFDFRC